MENIQKNLDYPPLVLPPIEQMHGFCSGLITGLQFIRPYFRQHIRWRKIEVLLYSTFSMIAQNNDDDILLAHKMI